MNARTSRLILLLDQYVDQHRTGTLDAATQRGLLDALDQESSSVVFQLIATDMWDRYSPVDVDVMIAILRKWIAVEPASREAKRSLGSYLLAHGPDWDQEGAALLNDTTNGC